MLTTLFIGQNMLHLPECGSTNAEAHLLLVKNKATEGTVVVCDNQTAGRGQRGNTWLSKPGQNLTFSCIVFPGFLSVQEQFWLTICTSLAIANAVQQFTQHSIRIKWPNDIFVNDQKIAGILIENNVNGTSVQSAVIGAGININQTEFALPQATSLHLLTGLAHNLTTILDACCQHLEKRYLQLRNRQYDILKQEYLHLLYRYQEWHTFIIGGSQLQAMITGVDKTGRLALQVDQHLVYCDLKEVAYVY